MVVRNSPRGLMAASSLLLAVLVASGLWFYRSQEQQLRHRTNDTLSGVAQLKADRISTWQSQRFGDAAVLLENKTIMGTAARWLMNSQQRDTGQKRILDCFESLRKFYGYRDLLLVDTNGEICLSLSGKLGQLPPDSLHSLRQSLSTHQPVLTDLHVWPDDGSVRMEAVAPIFNTDSNATPVGAILLQADARDYLYQVTQSWPTPSRSAETLFIRRDGQEVLYLNDLRFRSDTAFKYRVPLTQTNLPSVMAVLGRRGVVEGVDYSGVKVLAAIKEIPHSPWLMVTKMELKEALAEWHFRAMLICVVLVLLVGALTGNVIIVWQQHSKYQALAALTENLRQSEHRVQERTLELEESEERFRKLFADTAEATLLIENGRFTDCNRAALTELRMVSREQLCHLHPHEISAEFQPDGQRSDHKAEAMMRAVLERGSQMFEWEHIRANGEPFLVEVLLTPIRHRGRSLIHVVWRDITAYKRAEKLRTQLASIIESTTDFVAMAAPDGKIIFFNRVARQMFGLKDGDEPGQMTIDRSHPDWAAKLVQAQGIPTAIREGSWQGETAFINHEGKEIPHIQEIIAHKSPTGAVELISTVARSIVEQKKAQMLVKARLQLMEAAQTGTVDDFLQKVMDEVEACTGSVIGFYHFVDPDQENLTLQSWSTNTIRNMCTAEGKGHHYPVAKAGVWCDCIRERRPVIHNDYASLMHRKGLPPGHAPVQRIAVAPIFRKDQIVAVIGVGNKPTDYEPADIELVTLLGDFSWEIIERKRVEQRLLAEEHFFRLFMDNVPNRVYFKDLEGRFLRVNRSKLARHGFKDMSEIVGKTDFDLDPEEHARISRHEEQEILCSGVPMINREEHVFSADGTESWCVSHKIPFRDSAGQIIGILGISNDITERKRAEAALEHSLSLLQATLQSTADGILVVNQNGRIASYNQRFAELWKMPAALVQTNDDALILEHAIQQTKRPREFAARVAELYADPSRDSFDVVELNDGRVFERYSRPQFVANQVVGRVWCFRDVTRQRQAEAEQLKLLADLERSNKELEQFAYVASHDLQEPLRLVSAYTELLLTRYRSKLDAEADPLVNFITEGVTRMQRLIQDLLTYSRVSSRNKPMARLPVQKALDTALQNLTMAFRDQQATVTHDPLPELLGDETQLTQLFQNLIGNALKFRRPGTPLHIHVGVRQGEDEPGWTFYVQDNGMGIEPEFFERIFVIFQRLHSRKKYSGTGIGLAICKRIVERHGGRIWVESKTDQGTTFFFTVSTSQRIDGSFTLTDKQL